VVSDITSGLNALNRPVVNPNLLAHELGHVLGGVHPSENPGADLWRPLDEENILSPSGAAWLPIDKRNPLHNCVSAYNVAAEPDTAINATCVITPDP
jgi:hypothetical protein